MSTTIVQRGLHSCLKLQNVESMTLRLNLVPHKPQLPEPIITTVSSPSHVSNLVSKGEGSQVHDYITNRNDDNSANTSNSEFGGWSFIESLTKEAPYVHPLDKSCSSLLGKKSLEICTESLGSETGSEIGDEIDPYFSSSSDSETRKSAVAERSRFGQVVRTKEKETPRSFPPPLTSISDIQCTPSRKGGRLVIKVISVPTAHTCFEAERGDGRLRLYFKDSYSKSSTCSDEDTEDDESGRNTRSLNWKPYAT